MSATTPIRRPAAPPQRPKEPLVLDLPRGSGILLHPTSLPGPYGIGDLGPAAFAFADFLAAAGQRWWQMLPITPAGAGHSPYSGTSTRAGSPVLISPDRLVDEGLLTKAEAAACHLPASNRADFDGAEAAKLHALRQAFQRFEANKGGAKLKASFDTFLHSEREWLDDFALYEAIQADCGGRSWTDWPDPALSRREPAALKKASKRLAPDVRFQQFTQFIFDCQWRALRERLAADGICLIGDLPIFVSADSVDVWTRPDLFRVDERGKATHVAGVPPDYFNEEGQRWGNPLYRWGAHLKENFAWWTARLRGVQERFDLIRLDHFRGFEACFSIPADAPTAADPRCEWEKAPGFELLTAMRDGLGGRLPLIAEDLGVITGEVERLRDTFELPGMRVLQFAFGNNPLADVYLPFSYIPRCVAYTGTHDNDTTLGWLTAPPGATTQSTAELLAERAFVRRFLGLDASAPPTRAVLGLLRDAWQSVAETAIAPLQDWMTLGSEARMNVPGVAKGNWGWRFTEDQLSTEVLHRLAGATAVSGRWHGTVPEVYRTRLNAPAPEAPNPSKTPTNANKTNKANKPKPRAGRSKAKA